MSAPNFTLEPQRLLRRVIEKERELPESGTPESLAFRLSNACNSKLDLLLNIVTRQAGEIARLERKIDDLTAQLRVQPAAVVEASVAIAEHQ